MIRNKSFSSIIIFVIFILLLGAPSGNIYSQSINYEINSIPLKGEFINFSGRCFMQDSEGFMWFGSTEGLYRYHGTSTKVYRNIHNNDKSLSSNYVYDLYEDSKGAIWVGTRDGLNRFDKSTGLFTRYMHNLADTFSIQADYINKIAEDRDQNLWVATSRGFSRFDRKTETFTNYEIRGETTEVIKEPYNIYGMYPDKGGYLWLMTGDGVYRYTLASEYIEKMNDIFFTWDVYEDRSGRFWFICDHGLYLYNINQQSYELFLDEPENPNRLKTQNIRTMLEDESGNIWIRTLDGIYCYNQELELKYYMAHPEVYSYTYDIQGITKELFVDNTGTLWFYTPDGINQISNKGGNFRIYDFDRRIDLWVNCIYVESKNLIWYGSLHGICSLDRSNNSIKLHYGDTMWVSGFPHKAQSMYMDRDGTLWIGMAYEGLFSMVRSDAPVRQIRRYIPDIIDSTALDKPYLYNVTHIFEDSRGRLWIGDAEKETLKYYDRKKNRIVRLVNNPSAKDRLPGRAQIRHEKGSDTLWAVGSSGLYKIVPPFIKMSDTEMMASDVAKCQFVDDNGLRRDIPSVNVSYIDSTGDIWLGTHNEGLLKVFGQRTPDMEENEYKMKSFTTSQGLAGNQVMSILPDGEGNLWMGTRNGLSKFNMLSETFTNYYKRHGLPVNLFEIESAANGKDGEMFFGTINGLISFFPDSIKTNQHRAPVIITDIKIHNQTLEPGQNSELLFSISSTDNLELNYNQDNLSFEFAMLNYDNPELNQYKYKLEGFNDDWIYTGNRTKVDFTNLDPDKYTFRVLASNNDGIWNEKEASIQITIHPPPWRTLWAYILYGFILIGIIQLYRQYLLNRTKLRAAVEIERLEKEKVEELDQMRSRFFTNISHEFRTPLTLIQGPVEGLLKKKGQEVTIKRDVLGIIHRNAQRLHMLINQLLDISKLETGKVKLLVSEGELDKFVRRIVLSFLSLAESRHIIYEYDIPEIPGRIYLDQDKLEKIVTNIISNALKFTPPGGEIMVKLNYTLMVDQDAPEFIEISIKDSGKGIPQDQIDKIFDRFHQLASSDTRAYEGTGIGLSLARELVKIYRGEIMVESELGKGSVFTVVLPVAREQFKEDEIILPERAEPTESGSIPEARAAYPSDNDAEKPVILIVEDHADLRHYISTNLKDDFRILEAQNGREGLTKAVEEIPDLIITDLMMPEMDGMELCNRIRDDQRTDHIPLIMLTAKADKESKLEGFTIGADEYLIKPFDADELRVRVSNLILQRRKLRERYQREFMKNDPFTKVIPDLDDDFLSRVVGCIKEHLGDTDFSVELLGSEIGFSRSQLYRKILSLTGFVPNELIRNLRLKQAARMFQEGHSNITRVLYTVGFNSPSHFSRQFHSFFGMNPSEYIKQHRPSSK